jgi:hypothetical protein
MIDYWCAKCLCPIDSEYLESSFEPSPDIEAEYNENPNSDTEEEAEINCSGCNSLITFYRSAVFSDTEPEILTDYDGKESVAPPEIDHYDDGGGTGFLCLKDMGNAIVDKIDNDSANFTAELLIDYLEDLKNVEKVIEQIDGILKEGYVIIPSKGDSVIYDKERSPIKNSQRIVDIVTSMKTYVKENESPETSPETGDELF